MLGVGCGVWGVGLGVRGQGLMVRVWGFERVVLEFRVWDQGLRSRISDRLVTDGAGFILGPLKIPGVQGYLAHKKHPPP